jgi:hypothetical protein
VRGYRQEAIRDMAMSLTWLPVLMVLLAVPCIVTEASSAEESLTFPEIGG